MHRPVPACLEVSRRRNQCKRGGRRHRSPDLGPRIAPVVGTLNRAADRGSRQGGKRNHAEGHAEPRSGHVQPCGQCREGGGEDALETRLDYAVEYGEDVEASEVVHGEPAPRDDGDAEGHRRDEVDRAVSIRKQRDNDAEGQAGAVDDDHKDGCGGVGQTQAFLAE